MNFSPSDKLVVWFEVTSSAPVSRERNGSARTNGKQKHLPAETLKITVPAHKPIKRSTLSHIIKQAGLDADGFFDLV